MGRNILVCNVLMCWMSWQLPYLYPSFLLSWQKVLLYPNAISLCKCLYLQTGKFWFQQEVFSSYGAIDTSADISAGCLSEAPVGSKSISSFVELHLHQANSCFLKGNKGGENATVYIQYNNACKMKYKFTSQKGKLWAKKTPPNFASRKQLKQIMQSRSSS